MSDPLTYAKVGGPPDDWYGLTIINLDTGEEVKLVEEVNTVEGWVIRLVPDSHGNPQLVPHSDDELWRERTIGNFEIRRP